MSNRKSQYEYLTGLFFMLTAAYVFLTAAGIIKGKNDAIVQASQENLDQVYACGFPVGIYMDINGILVIGQEEVVDGAGKERLPSQYILLPGDYIRKINGEVLENKNHMMDLVRKSQGKTMQLEICRDGSLLTVEVTPVKDQNGKYMLGVWVRDNVQGIGTMTYVDQNGKFAALGHGINDIDLGTELDIAHGKLYQASILSVQKGENGKPGELRGAIDYRNQNKIGSITGNSSNGITGVADMEKIRDYPKKQCILGTQDDLKTGAAVILCDIGMGVEEYKINITKINWKQKDTNKSFEIQVEDERLLAYTGGIIRGMSGSPIIQNGRLVGAVTHVLVNDPTRGYGIFIENMSDSSENTK